MAQTLNKNQLGHTRVGLSIDLKRAHMTWHFSSSSSTSNSQTRFAQRLMKKSANQIQTRLKTVSYWNSSSSSSSLTFALLAFALSVRTAIPPMVNSSGISQNHTLKVHFLIADHVCECVDFAQEWIRVFEYLHFYWISIFHEISLHISFVNSHIVKFLLITFSSNFIWGFIASY